jgi:hypothetical protein
MNGLREIAEGKRIAKEELLASLRAAVVCKSEHQGFKKVKESMGQCKSGGKDFKRDYAKEKLRENMGQCESKERGFKE